MSLERAGLVKVVSPDTDKELVAIVEMLEAREVPCFVSNARRGTGTSAVQGRVSKPRTILVPAARLAEAVAFIGELQRPQAAHLEVARNPCLRWVGALVRLVWSGWLPKADDK